MWPNRVPSINSVKTSQLWDGRFAVKIGNTNDSKGGSGAFTLTHENQIDTLDIRNPLGGAPPNGFLISKLSWTTLACARFIKMVKW